MCPSGCYKDLDPLTSRDNFRMLSWKVWITLKGKQKQIDTKKQTHGGAQTAHGALLVTYAKTHKMRRPKSLPT